MLRLTAVALLCLLPSAATLPVLAQDAAPAEQAPKNPFFSGTISALAEDKVTVVKTVWGKNKETRTFLITKETRIEGNLKLKARVTVRYVHDDEGDRAAHIIVRTSSKR